MSRYFTVIALVGVALGARHFLGHRSRRNAQRTDSIQTWESEGGAVPIASNRTAAQIAPYEAPSNAEIRSTPPAPALA